VSVFCFNDISISGIAAAVPDNKLTIEEFANNSGYDLAELKKDEKYRDFVFNSIEKQTASDLGYIAASELLTAKNIDRNDIGIILFVSQTPDYRSPATAMVLHNRLALNQNCLAYDINLGNTGFITGLSVIGSLLDKMPTKRALLVVGDTPSKQFFKNNPERLLFSDSAAAVLLDKTKENKPVNIQLFSDGSEHQSFLLKENGFRLSDYNTKISNNDIGPVFLKENIYVDYELLHDYFINHVPVAISDFIIKQGIEIGAIDIIAMQAFCLDTSRMILKTTGLPESKAPVLGHYGCTSGASTPLILCSTLAGVKNKCFQVLSCSFGGGLSYGIGSFCIESDAVLPVISTNDFFSEGAVTD